MISVYLLLDYVYKHKKSHTTIAGNMRFYAALQHLLAVL